MASTSNDPADLEPIADDNSHETDLHRLFTNYDADPLGFWNTLAERARASNLPRPRNTSVPVVKKKPRIAIRNYSDTETADSQLQSSLFKLPIELRIVLYGLVLSCGDFNDANDSITYTIRDLDALLDGIDVPRVNKYVLKNAGQVSFALLETCIRIRDEIRTHVVPKIVWHFKSAGVFEGFIRDPDRSKCKVHIDASRLELVRASHRIEIMIPIDNFCDRVVFQLRRVGREIGSPMDLHLIDEGGSNGVPSEGFRTAEISWNTEMEKLRNKT